MSGSAPKGPAGELGYKHKPVNKERHSDDKHKTVKKERKSLTWHQKFELIIAKEASSKLTYHDLQVISFDRFRVLPAMGTLSRMMQPACVKEVKEHVRLYGADNCVRNRPSRVHGLNEALAAWERAVSNNSGACVTDEQLIAQVKKIGAKMDFPADFQYSRTAWLALFKKKMIVVQPTQQLRTCGWYQPCTFFRCAHTDCTKL